MGLPNFAVAAFSFYVERKLMLNYGFDALFLAQTLIGFVFTDLNHDEEKI